MGRAAIRATVDASHATGVRGSDAIWRLVDRGGALLALVALAVMTQGWMAEQADVEREARKAAGDVSSGVHEAADAERMIAGYFGTPYTHPSDVKIANPKEGTNLTLKEPGWDARPFKSPIYYGVRVVRWGHGSRFGSMVDFTHSKTITRPEEVVKLEGTLNGKPVPGEAKVKDLFKHLEFSHGHNMLTLNGLMRLVSPVARVSPYIGGGIGVALPHTEVKLHAEPARTYEYQYAGPVAQGVAGLEIRLPAVSLFFEYKLTFAEYSAPLSRLEGGTLFSDLWRQFQLWREGNPPPGGYVSTRLVSHNPIAGAGYRF